MSTNERTFQKPFSVATSGDYEEALQQLNAELKNIQKNITYLDAYNITTSVTTEADFPSTQALLVPGSALVINTPYSFEFGGDTYRVGDVVLRLATGDLVHIRAQVGGLYYPKKLESVGGGYNLSYEYLAATPTQENADVSNNEVTTPGKNITFTGITAEADSNIYGIWDKINPSYNSSKGEYITSDTVVGDYHYSFPSKFKQNSDQTYSLISPVVKFFYSVDGVACVDELKIAYTLKHRQFQANAGVWYVKLYDDWDSTVHPDNWHLYIMVK